MYVCTYVCMFIYMYACMYTYVYIYEGMCIYARIHIYNYSFHVGSKEDVGKRDIVRTIGTASFDRSL